MGEAHLRRYARDREIADHPPLHMLHDIEHMTDDAFVLAQHIGLGRRHIGTGQRRDHPVFAVNRMRRRQQLARRLLAHDIARAGAVLQHEGRVRHAAAELADGQGPGEALHVFGHEVFQPILGKLVLLQHLVGLQGRRYLTGTSHGLRRPRQFL